MHTSRPLTDAQRAGGILAHPLMLILGDASVEALASIATGEAPVSTTAECAFLREALAVIDAAEIHISRRAA